MSNMSNCQNTRHGGKSKIIFREQYLNLNLIIPSYQLYDYTYLTYSVCVEVWHYVSRVCQSQPAITFDQKLFTICLRSRCLRWVQFVNNLKRIRVINNKPQPTDVCLIDVYLVVRLFSVFRQFYNQQNVEHLLSSQKFISRVCVIRRSMAFISPNL